MDFRYFDVHFRAGLCGPVSVVPGDLLVHQGSKIGFAGPNHLPFAGDGPGGRHEPAVNEYNGTIDGEQLNRLQGIIDDLL